MTLTTAQCATIAKVAHNGQKYGKMDYYAGHVVKVVEELGEGVGQPLKQIAYLHDVVEDSDFSMTDLAHLGVDRHVLECLAWLTHEKGVSYAEYIENIVTVAPWRAALVKMADLRVNLAMSQETLKNTPPTCEGHHKAKARVNKYSLALLAFKMVDRP